MGLLVAARVVSSPLVEVVISEAEEEEVDLVRWGVAVVEAELDQWEVAVVEVVLVPWVVVVVEAELSQWVVVVVEVVLVPWAGVVVVDEEVGLSQWAGVVVVGEEVDSDLWAEEVVVGEMDMDPFTPTASGSITFSDTGGTISTIILIPPIILITITIPTTIMRTTAIARMPMPSRPIQNGKHAQPARIVAFVCLDHCARMAPCATTSSHATTISVIFRWSVRVHMK